MKKIRFVRSSSFIVGVVFTSLIALGIVFVSNFILIAENETLLKESEAALKAEAARYSQLYHHGGLPLVRSVLQQTLNAPENDYFLALKESDDNTQLTNVPNWPGEANTLTSGLFQFHLTRNETPNDESANVMATVVLLDPALSQEKSAQLLIGRNVTTLKEAQWLSGTFGWLLILVLLSIAVLSFLIAFYVVNRINRMTSIINQIMNTGNLSSRLEVDSSWDDLSMLSIEFNRMLRALEEMVTSVKSVSDNIAHDLRTPLTRLRGKLELAQDISEKQNLLAEVDNILNVFNGLLRIADIEAEKQKSAFRLNQLNHIVEDLVSLYDVLAEEKSQRLQVDIEDCVMVSDRDLLFQAFANILDNAIKFTPEGGLINISLKSTPRHVLISFCDSGPGIADQYKDQVTKRFYRIESSRTSKGNGLGLALVNAVVKLHKGKLSFASNSATSEGKIGLCCTIELPR